MTANNIKVHKNGKDVYGRFARIIAAKSLD
jgi:hypothetical protein